MGYPNVNVKTFWAKDSKNVRASAILPEILARLRPSLAACSLNCIHQSVDNFVMSSASLASSFVAENVPGVKLETRSTMARCEAGNWLVES